MEIGEIVGDKFWKSKRIYVILTFQYEMIELPKKCFEERGSHVQAEHERWILFNTFKSLSDFFGEAS